MKNRKMKRSPNYRKEEFKPSRLFIEEAVEDFLNNGGNITKLTKKSSNYSSISTENSLQDVEDYFAEKCNFASESKN